MRNFLLCKAIHYPVMNCQEDVWIKAVNDKVAQEAELMLENMITVGMGKLCVAPIKTVDWLYRRNVVAIGKLDKV